MRNSTFLKGVVLALFAILPVLVRAQFQQPTDEELKMTADPKAPGAAAVYLNIEEIANDPIHYQSYYARIKVLTEKGKELATVSLPYLRGDFKISDIKGRTIHADGTVIPLNVKPEDLMVAKTGDVQIGRKVFTLPSVEVGSILEYKYELHYDDHHYSSPEWNIQQKYFVHTAHYQFKPFQAYMPTGSANSDTSMYLTDGRGRVVKSLIWWGHMPTGVTTKTSLNGFYSVDVTDVPAIPDEEWMPPDNTLHYKLFFYYSFAYDPKDFWLSETKFWAKDVDKFAEPSKAVKTAVDGLIAPADSDLDKAKKLYAAVQTLDNTDYSRKKSESELKELKIKEAKHAEDTWTQKSGSGEDIAMLYLAMLRAAGLTAYPTKVVDRNEGVFDPSYMSLNQLDTTLVTLSIGGNLTVLDPGEKMCPFGTLNWRHSGASGLSESPQGVATATTPLQNYKDNTTSRTGELTLDGHGGITGNFTFVMTGQEALRWRQDALRNDQDELKKQFDKSLEGLVPDGVEAHVDHFLGLDTPDANLLAIVKVSGSMGTATAKRLLLPGFFFESRTHQPFVNEEKREVAVDMHYGEQESETVTYHLPDGMTVEGAPQDAKVSWTGHAVFVTKTAAAPGQIVIADTIARAFTQAKPEEYQDLRGFYQKVDAAAQGQIVLTVAATADGAPAAAPPGKGN